MAPDRATAEAALGTFETKYAAKYGKAVDCLTKDREALLAFYDFSAEHWEHVRTTNPIESVFATVRHRTVRTKGCLSQETAKLMVFKLITAAAFCRFFMPQIGQGQPAPAPYPHDWPFRAYPGVSSGNRPTDALRREPSDEKAPPNRQ